MNPADAVWQAVAESDPEFFAACAALAEAPALEPKVRELIAIAVNASATHLHEPGLRRHIRGALAEGASRAEITAVLQLVSVVGIHAVSTGVPLLPGPPEATRPELKAEFIARRGYWDPVWEQVLALDPGFFAAYLEFSAIPWQGGTLSPKLRELVYVAIDASATHMYVPGLKVHIENALGYGATPAEVMAVLEVASLIGLQTVEVAMPILLEELREAES
ncbi:carboxymuconolactone decarboxylase family protein [Amycolatopsis jejuensis]|uniref:carboxymuconolactone decarboxylase family protein n=1 Tax=Amycolatopsis jejuensis TaxID=330084 RepID=UPI00068FF39C|nr:carboxymuconolactone decarboxylase family protein [Amycolatopsis jejuensis]